MRSRREKISVNLSRSFKFDASSSPEIVPSRSRNSSLIFTSACFMLYLQSFYAHVEQGLKVVGKGIENIARVTQD